MIGLAKFVKGCITIPQLMNMDNGFIQTLYKQYFESSKKNPNGQVEEEVMDELEDAMN